MKRTSVRSSIEVDIAVLYAVKHLRNITGIHARSRTDYHLMIRRLARFETRGLLTKLGTRYELTEKGEEMIRQWTRIRHLTGYTYLTGHAREATPS